MITDEQYYQISDRAHFLFGVLIVGAPGLAFGIKYGLYIAAPFIGWAAWKEFYFDEHEETPEVSGGTKGDWRDFYGYCLGAATGIIGCLIKLFVLK